MPVPSMTTSAAGSLALLDDSDTGVRGYALQHLLSIVAQFWAEISDSLPLLPLAALLVSKIYFYIGELHEAVEFALKAGAAFDKETNGEYKETIIAGCIDRAISLTNKPGFDGSIDTNLQAIVDGVLKSNSIDDGKLAIGLALSLRRLDIIELIFTSSKAPAASSSTSKQDQGAEHDESLLRYILSEIVSGASGNENWSPEFREKLFELLLRLFRMNSSPDWNSITTVWVQSNAHESCAEALVELLEAGSVAEAYQIGFDLFEVAGQAFIQDLRKDLEKKGWQSQDSEGDRSPRNMLEDILTGKRSSELFLNFLNNNNKTDPSILKVVKDSLEDRYSIYHSAITFTNAFANCGTASDKFLRENLDYLGRSSNWAKFSATAALGLIHRGSWINGIKVVTPYLPGGVTPSKYSEGGALFALGLIHAGKRQAAAEAKLRQALGEGNDPIVQHGAALGMGVTALATADDDVYEEIRTILFADNATAGEAAGYAMGLIMLGTASDRAFEEMLSYARETQHEKIIRSLAVGIAFLVYGKREAAEGVIKILMEDKDAILRYGGMFAIALAYAGTGNNRAVRKLLHVAVSDVNDDVRRAAVTALGFVMFRNHTQVPRVVQLLAESYNPHVRHGATFALGISCAGTGLEAAIDLLEPMTKDPVDFVRQGAYISLAMILIQQSEAQTPKSTSVRELFAKVVADKHEDPMARFGASLAQGIIDAGGRNMTLSLSTRAGTLNLPGIIGMTLFVQFWYWFPLAHGLGLAMTPTTVIAVDSEIRIPKIDLQCHSKPSMFAYPAPAKVKKEEEKKKTKTAVLSTTAKAVARAKSKQKEQGDGMDLDDKPASPAVESKGTPPSSGATAGSKKERKSEPSSFKFENMTRVTPLQLPLINFLPGRYEPLRSLNRGVGTSGGSIIIVKDNEPESQDGEYLPLNDNLWPDAVPPPPAQEQGQAGGIPVVNEGMELDEGGEEAAPPESFEYPFED